MNKFTNNLNIKLWESWPILLLFIVVAIFFFVLWKPLLAPDPVSISEVDTIIPLDTASTTSLAINIPTKTQITTSASTPIKKSGEIMAWIYPGEPGCLAPQEYRDGRQIDVLKPEYYQVGEGGELLFLSEGYSGCNGYSPANVVDIAKYSKKQFVTVASAYSVDMGLFLEKALDDGESIKTLVDFTVNNSFEGVELDFEDFGGWTAEHYDLYKKFVKSIGDALHAKGKDLMLVGPATANAEQEAWFKWRYGDFVSLPVDMIIIMTYDYQYDAGAGNPIAPFSWIEGSIEWALARFPDKSRLGAGIPSYGYRGVAGTQTMKLQNLTETVADIGKIAGTRDTSSGELTHKNLSMNYFYQDSSSMDQKYARIAKYGLAGVSVWSLGGNPWFSR